MFGAQKKCTPERLAHYNIFSSLCRDDDDDIAHEFWEETKPKDGKTRMKRVLKTYPLVIKL